ncbi:serine/threonine protein kinase [Sphaeroforma arctica JP610]|uniref:non-specific serine/threonine protein kinase n=1 Tax=Sphaeroforma arctica JP610 TaxID=667725 RepID=A0A0L0FSL5_9EUKA|nr:serine/threonine protein kinase [Sphaeroforma arctica JP610]KNC79770.1 serine/threonine protein kinase [Sphaeroforma arctica JP610]|eukprot:XP_014153672.1 serine/threonine protein kinase [Sphaeroforma arctica JP610]
MGNFYQVNLLSDRQGRTVRLVTDSDGKRVVIKSYNLTTSTHLSHFIEMCSKTGDLKPENIFLTSTLEAVLGDFDVVRDANGSISDASGVTCHYRSPEISDGLVSRIAKSADVYSLGLLLRELFNGVSLSGIYKTVSDEDIASLCARMVAEHPIVRPTLPEVASMPVFSEVKSARLRFAVRHM